VNFNCTGLPSEASCAPNPTGVAPTSGPITATLTIITGAPAISANRAPALPPSFGGDRMVLAGIGLGFLAIFLVPRRYRSRTAWLPAALLFVGALSLSGCGAVKNAINQNTDPGTPAGTYTVTVTGSATNSDGTAITHTATVSLTVQ
jgi:peptidoglycan/LPS O-acetylase OafA/YrhL